MCPGTIILCPGDTYISCEQKSEMTVIIFESDCSGCFVNNRLYKSKSKKIRVIDYHNKPSRHNGGLTWAVAVED